MSREKHKEYGARLREITAVLRSRGITRGVTPEKLRLILEDLGPAYIKLGQVMSMHSDILPKKYCDELMKLHSEAAPMDFQEVRQVIEEAYGAPAEEIFARIEETPLGSASIAQVHRAVLKTGEQVVVKVQRKGVYELMSRDIALLHRAVKLLPPINMKDLVDLDMVLDERWDVAREEMDFLIEAANMEEFAARNKDVAFISVPALYKQYTTSKVLVMEYIQGLSVDDKEGLTEEGYDLKEIGSKLADNYMKQVMEDGFFHADPHPGNVKVREGKIVWIDMGMMGRLSERDKELIAKAVKGVAVNDIGAILESVMALGEFRGKPDQSRLYQDIGTLLSKYGTVDMGNIRLAEVMESLMEVMKENKISMPHGLTMLARGLTHMEGVLVEISPEINMVKIASARGAGRILGGLNWEKEIKKEAKALAQSLYKAVDIPGLTADILHGYLKGQTRINLDLHAGEDLSGLLMALIKKLVMGLLVTGLLIGSSILCTTDMKPKLWGIPAIGAIGYILAFGITLCIFLRHMRSGKQ